VKVFPPRHLFAFGICLYEMFTGRRLFSGDTDYQTVELVRQARVPSLQALNPEIESELEQIVRKALSRNPDDRYGHAADLGDALAQYLFSRRMKVTSRDITNLVRDTQMEMMRKRSAGPKESIGTLINDEVRRLSSVVDSGEEIEPGPRGPKAIGSASLDPLQFVDTTAWASDFDSSVNLRQVPTADNAAPSNRPQISPVRLAGRPRTRTDVESLSAMLEPDRTGLHRRRSNRILIAVAAIFLLAAVGASILVVTELV
jgi:serine/threonine-protein kinase